jgi:uncharacterized 2Fe-2S/4Fe-4S cluster protein (DUF4445 family)
MSAEEYTVVFQPSGARGKVAAGTHLRAAARTLGVEIESVCAENATCGKCRVLIETGRMGGVSSALDHVTPMGAAEAEYLEKRARVWDRIGLDKERLRLSCQAEVCGDVVVFVPESSRGNRQIIRKSATDRAIDIRPTVRRYLVEMVPATLENPRGDVERLTDALVEVMDKVRAEPDWEAPSADEIRYDLPLLRRVADVIREGEWKVTVAVWDDREVIDIRPGYHEGAYGAAVDIGSTAIALYLCDLESGEVLATESMMNPQTAYGDDIMSRMSYEMDNPDGLATLHDAVVESLNTLLARARRSQGLDHDDVLEMVVVGNTTMHHLFLGMPTRHLGLAPFVPTLHRSLDIKARDLGLEINPSGNVHLLPIEASFVGADNMAVLVAEEPHLQDEELLIIDVGTNAELVLGNRERLLCTSTPTGPAFEGAHIEYGMRAAPGAIERVRIDPDTLEPEYSVIGDMPAKGICGSAIIDGVAEMFRTGVIDAKGRVATGLDSSRIREGEFGWEYVIALEDDTSIGRDIPITIQDVRQIQLAKSALYTAARILLREAGLEAPDRIILAGAFGAHIDPTRALILGMIPDCPIERVHSVGNAAGDGARIALLNREKRQEAIELARSVRRIELPVDPEFQNQYMMALNFPHMAHRFASIEHLIPEQVPDPIAERFMEGLTEGESS